MKEDIHSFNIGYSRMPCPKRLQRYGPGEGPFGSPLLDNETKLSSQHHWQVLTQKTHVESFPQLCGCSLKAATVQFHLIFHLDPYALKVVANWKMTSQVLGLPPFEITCTLPNFKVLFPYIKPVASDVHQQLLTGVKSAATTFKSDHEVSGEISSQIFLSKNNFIAEWQILFSDPDCGGVTGMPCLSRPGICRATTRGHR